MSSNSSSTASELSIHTIACTIDVTEYRLFSIKEFLSIGVFFLCKADKIWWMVLGGYGCPSCFLTSVTNRDSQKFNFEEILWTLSEMPPFLCTLHSENTRIAQALFFWVFAGTKPFDNTAISSLLVGHLNRATGSRVVFAFFGGGWKSLKSESTFSFPAILEMCYTYYYTTGRDLP